MDNSEILFIKYTCESHLAPCKEASEAILFPITNQARKPKVPTLSLSRALSFNLSSLDRARPQYHESIQDIRRTSTPLPLI